MNSYQDLANWLRTRGIEGYLQSEDLLVLSRQNPALPGSNCLWVQKKHDHWYLGTWLPAVYRVPKEQDVRYVCEKVFSSSNHAIYIIDPVLERVLALQRLSDEEMEQMGFE